jgi:ribokinase
MQVFNIGSINWDHCYQVEHFVRPGETLGTRNYVKVMGGKGANQSVALASSGVSVIHIGALGEGDTTAKEALSDLGVDMQHVPLLSQQATGHAIIQVEDAGENAILLFPGANHALTMTQIQDGLASSQAGDWVLLQNETNLIEEIIPYAKSLKLNVAFNPAPMDKALTLSVLNELDLLIVNEVELADLAQTDDANGAFSQAKEWSKERRIMVTLGSKGVKFFDQGIEQSFAGFNVDAVDTTAAGDTFIGFFLGGLTQGLKIADLLQQACAAAAICVTRTGAIPAIPKLEEVRSFLKDR